MTGLAIRNGGFHSEGQLIVNSVDYDALLLIVTYVAVIY